MADNYINSNLIVDGFINLIPTGSIVTTPNNGIYAAGGIIGQYLKIHGGTNNQFLKADGSVDANNYAYTLFSQNHSPSDNFDNYLSNGTINITSSGYWYQNAAGTGYPDKHPQMRAGAMISSLGLYGEFRQLYFDNWGQLFVRGYGEGIVSSAWWRFWSSSDFQQTDVNKLKSLWQPTIKARYIKVSSIDGNQIPGSFPPIYFEIAEIQVYAGGVNVALSKPVSGTAVNYNGNPLSIINNGSTNVYDYFADSVNGYIIIDLQAEYNITDITTFYGIYGNYNIADVHYSIDNLTYTKYATFSGGAETINISVLQVKAGKWDAQYTLPSGGTTLQYVDGTGSLQTFPSIAGPQGYQGAIGLQGVSGLTGLQGATGSQGYMGYQGFIGSTGLQGAIGYQGLMGSTGLQGLQGIIGIQGSTGSNGTQGLTGSSGLQGVAGPIGYQGSLGSAGLQGSIGLQGLTGYQGSTGGVGLQGSAGSNGSPGVQGPIGPQGSSNGDGGEYTPSLYSSSNVINANFQRGLFINMSNIVSFTINLQFQTSTTGTAQMNIIIPIASTFTGNYNAMGVTSTTQYLQTFGVYSNPSSGTLFISVNSLSTSAVHEMTITGHYHIL